jgi:SAM-dependent methyltransferase
MGLVHETEQVDPFVLALCDDIVASGVDLGVHAEDEMFRLFFYRLGHQGAALASYFRSGAAIWESLRRVLEWRWGDVARVGSLLDFASGYGRVSRFIARALPPERVWVADVYAEGVRFQEERFGVHGLVSTAEPEAFGTPRRFDCIFVSSLFTHLPERTFTRWLARLWSLVVPGGVLAFSVHDPSLLGDGAAAGDGFRFEPVSESGSLSLEDYGTCWVSEEFVRRALAGAAPGAAVTRFPRALCNFQDLYVAAAGTPGGAPPDLSGRPEGYVETCRQIGPRRLALAGWAVDRMHGAPPAAVEAAVDGTVVGSCRRLPARPDAAPLYPGERVQPVGWRVDFELPVAAPLAACRFEVRAVDRAGRTGTLWEGTAEAALLRAARLDLLATYAALGREREEHEALLAAERATSGREIAALGARIAGMRASRFWKLRDRWFALKRALHLTDEL